MVALLSFVDFTVKSNRVKYELRGLVMKNMPFFTSRFAKPTKGAVSLTETLIFRQVLHQCYE